MPMDVAPLCSPLTCYCWCCSRQWLSQIQQRLLYVSYSYTKGATSRRRQQHGKGETLTPGKDSSTPPGWWSTMNYAEFCNSRPLPTKARRERSLPHSLASFTPLSIICRSPTCIYKHFAGFPIDVVNLQRQQELVNVKKKWRHYQFNSSNTYAT